MTNVKVFNPVFWPKTEKTKFVDVNFKNGFKNYNDYKGENKNYNGEHKNWYSYISKLGEIQVN